MASAKPAPFLTRLYDMVSDPTTDYAIAWNGHVSVPVAGAPAGRINAFTVIDNAALEKEVIPRFYKHSNFTSFIRQLNQYRFRKLEAKRWTFGHPCFVKGSPNILTNIRRKRKSAPPKPPERGAPAAAARRSPGSDEEIDAEAAMAQCREQTTVLERRVDQLSNSLHSALAQQAAMAQQLAAIHAYVFGGRGQVRHQARPCLLVAMPSMRCTNRGRCLGCAQGPNQARLPVPQENALAPHPSTVPVAGQPSAQREQPAAQEPASKRQMLTATPPVTTNAEFCCLSRNPSLRG